MPELYTRDPDTGKVRLHLHWGQQMCWLSEHRFTFFLAGTQSGKTSFGPWWLWREIRNRGAGDYLAVTATYDLFELKMLPEMRKVLEYEAGVARYWAKTQVLEICEGAEPGGKFLAERASDPMWGRIILRSANAEGGLESATAKGAWLDECGQDQFGVQAWEAIRRRLSLNRGRALGTTTPYVYNWLKTTVVDNAKIIGQSGVIQEPSDPKYNDFLVVNSPSIINPSFDQEEFESARRSMPAHRFDMFYRGIFRRATGLVFEDFDPQTMMAQEPNHNRDSWRYLAGLDFGWNAPTAAVLLACSPDDQIYVIREYYARYLTLEEHIPAWREWEEVLNVRIAWYPDPSEPAYIEQMRRKGFYVRETNNDVLGGIDAINEYIRTDRFRVCEGMSNLLTEMENYVWEIDRKSDDDAPIDRPRKANDHLMDALRYAVLGWKAYVHPAGRSGDQGGVAGTGSARERMRSSMFNARRGRPGKL